MPPARAAACALLLLLAAATARATDYGAATSSGTWSNVAAWTPAGIPAAADNVFIGSNYPGGAAASASVVLAQSQSASNVFLGNNSGDNGTLNLGNYNLVVGNNLTIGSSLGSTGSIQRGSGRFTAANLNVYYANAFTFGAADAVSNLNLASSGGVTTAATGNVTSTVQVFTGSKLTLGGNMALGGNLDMEYAGSTLDMGGHALSASTINFGYNQPGLVTVVNPGQITAATLNVANGCLAALPAGSAVASLNLATSGQLTTAATGSVTSAVQVYTGSKLTLGGNMALSGNFDMEYAGSTLDMGGHALSASTINFGFNQPGLVTVVNPGQITAATLNVANGCLAALPAGSTVASLNLATSGQLTTAATGSVTNAVQVFTGSKLTLGGNMALGGNLDMEYAGSTLDMGSHALSANTIYFGFNQPGLVTVANPGQITAATLNVGNGCLVALPAGSAVASLNLATSGQLTTAATGSVTSAVQVFTGSKLTLGGNMALSGNFDMEYAGSTLDMGGHALNASTINFGFNQAGLVTIVNPGQITAATLNVGNGCPVALPAGSAVASLNLATSGQLTTAATGSVTSAVQVFTGSKLTLGGNMALGGNFDMEYAGSTLDMGGHALTQARSSSGLTKPAWSPSSIPGRSRRPPSTSATAAWSPFPPAAPLPASTLPPAGS